MAAPAPPAAQPEPPAAQPGPSSAQPGPSAGEPVADPCAVVTREYLITTLRMTGGPQFPLADLQQPRCLGLFATAMGTSDGASPAEVYLFQYGEHAGQKHWRVIDVGTDLDCVNRHGVPAADARPLQCA
ncbi:hypothetical protein [Nocardia cyriacigeorgica]|uniref:hypothetical protein n=1 Tax=Nocardia cyriacigeorgica TaxID=135487 RepID=UPI0024561A7D|nr:hypothetical protein [Nocardia cyriacigeorgica]